MLKLKEMVDRLKAWNIEAEYEYYPKGMIYILSATRGNRTVVRNLPVLHALVPISDTHSRADEERRSAVRDIIEDFYKDILITIDDMRDILVRYGMSVCTEGITNSVGKHEVHWRSQ